MEGKKVSRRRSASGNVSSGTYGLGLIGALVYFIGHATSFGDGALGVLKALLWPAFLVYHLLEHLNM
ncbi:MAG: hypothetical protein ABI778_00155 [Ignavibacteriota bacterium]